MPHRQTPGFQDNIQGLIPWHIFEAQCDIAADRITCHHIEIGKIGDQLQYRPDLNILEIERQAFAGKVKFIPGRGLFFLRERLEFDNVLIFGLIGEMVIIVSHGADRHGHIIVARGGVDLLDGRGEINHIQPAVQCLGQLRVNKVDHDPAAPEPHINRNSRVGQINDHPSFAVFAAAKINILQAVLAIGAGGEDHVSCGGRRPVHIRLQGQDDIAARDGHVIGNRAGQIDHHARATGGLHGIEAVCHADADPL